MLSPLSLQLPQLPPPNLAGGLTSPTSSPEANRGLFGQMLTDAMAGVSHQQNQAEMLVEDHLLGRPVTDIEVMTAIKQAELTMKTMIQVRNKAVEAYKELKQIQV